MRMNVKQQSSLRTHEGAPAKHIGAEAALRRSVMSCFLWEKEFYESGKAIADRIVELCAQVKPEFIATLAVEARTTGNLRHVPLLLLVQLVKHGKGQMVAEAICNVIQRADELAEFLALYWSPAKQKLSNPMRKGLAKAFLKFDEYQLAKYNRDGAVKLRDVLFLCHAKPDDAARADLWKRLVAGELKTPDTWEVELSAGKDKKATFERLIAEKKLGYLALLRNLRNMEQAGCDRDLVRNAIIARKGGAERVLPFRFTAAARAAPSYEAALDRALLEGIEQLPKLRGTTVVLVDVSGSMDWPLSGKSDLKRVDAAATLASVINAEDLRVFSFSTATKEVPARRGMAGVQAIITSQAHGGTDLGLAVRIANGMKHDRLIVITDEQSQSRVPDPVVKHAYMINVASNRNGVGYGKWTQIDGFSENVLRFIYEVENAD